MKHAPEIDERPPRQQMPEEKKILAMVPSAQTEISFSEILRAFWTWLSLETKVGTTQPSATRIRQFDIDERMVVDNAQVLLLQAEEVNLCLTAQAWSEGSQGSYEHGT